MEILEKIEKNLNESIEYKKNIKITVPSFSFICDIYTWPESNQPNVKDYKYYDLEHYNNSLQDVLDKVMLEVIQKLTGEKGKSLGIGSHSAVFPCSFKFEVNK